MDVRRLDRNTFDVFLGTQWDNHIRVRVGRSSIYRLSGMRLDRGSMQHLEEILHPVMPITYGQTQDETLRLCKAI